MIVGIGIDLVEVQRMRKILNESKSKFADRFFHPQEVLYCSKKSDPAPYYAARFAAKEAFLKALGSGISEGIELSKIEVTKNEKGCPGIEIHSEKINAMCQKIGLKKLFLSLSHTENYAVAKVIFEN